jgi:hypothetical protein
MECRRVQFGYHVSAVIESRLYLGDRYQLTSTGLTGVKVVLYCLERQSGPGFPARKGGCLRCGAQ